MNRIKALYRSWSIPCGGASVYAPRDRAEWLSKITEPGVRRRAELFYLQLDGLQKLRQEARRDLLAESRRQAATNLLQGIPYIGPIRGAADRFTGPNPAKLPGTDWGRAGSLRVAGSAQSVGRVLAWQCRRGSRPP
jgi:hypothetical protein